MFLYNNNNNSFLVACAFDSAAVNYANITYNQYSVGVSIVILFDDCHTSTFRPINSPQSLQVLLL